MFPVVGSPNTAAIFNLAGGGATPSTVDFHRTAMRAAAAEREQQAQPPLPATSQPQELSNGAPAVKSEAKPTGPFDNHDNDAANGLFMLAQGRNGAQQQSQYPLPPQPADHVQATFDGSDASGPCGAGSPLPVSRAESPRLRAV